ncbi:MAG TPA: hypothetical protein VH369_00960 [Bryobacteraceae bacterium]|jgi:hypothetical protein
MSAPLLPSPLDYVGHRRFAFYPPIAHPEPNEWVLGLGARAEVQVVNARTGTEIWIARQYIGAVSETSTSLIVGLTQALDVREGSVEPKVKQVIQMPASKADRLPRRQPSKPAAVVEIRLESRSKSPLSRVLITTCTGAIVVALLAALITAAIKF